MVEQTSRPKMASPPSEAADYGQFYYRHDCGLPYERNASWLSFFDRIAEAIVREFHPSTVLDAGCAMGFLVEALRKRGVEAWGIDISDYAISQVHDSVRDYCRVGSLTDPIERRYDLITCIEVIEHIPASEADTAIANLCAASDQLLLSSTPHDYGEATHFNVQAPEVWSAALAREGFLRDLDHDISYLTPWAAVYTRREEPLPETVRRYDRSWWRLRQEVSEVRGSLLKAQNRLAELESEGSEKPPDQLEELDRRDEEILRLRDLLIGRDAELGTVRGHLAIVEDQMQRFANVAERVPRIVRIPTTFLLRLRTLLRR